MRSDKRGFTLVEMMIALVVLSLISLGTLTAMRTLGMTQERLTTTTNRVDELRQVSQFLRDSLRQAVVPPQGGFGGTWGVSVPGLPVAGHDELVWLAPFDAAGGAGGLNYLRLYRDGDYLRLQFQPHREELDQASWLSRDAGEVLVRDLEEFGIHYRLSLDDPWIEQASEDELTDLMPASLRLVVRAGGRYWPELVVSPVQGGNGQ